MSFIRQTLYQNPWLEASLSICALLVGALVSSSNLGTSEAPRMPLPVSTRRAGVMGSAPGPAMALTEDDLPTQPKYHGKVC